MLSRCTSTSTHTHACTQHTHTCTHTTHTHVHAHNTHTCTHTTYTHLHAHTHTHTHTVDKGTCATFASFHCLQYLGKTHNAWHRAVLMLEERALANGDFDLQPKIPPKYEGELVGQSLEPLKQETLDALSDLYSSLCEEDMWTGMWVLRSRYVRRSYHGLCSVQAWTRKCTCSHMRTHTCTHAPRSRRHVLGRDL